MVSKTSQWLIQLSEHPKAKHILTSIAFLESWIFPIPPDLLLVPMVVQHPEQRWNLAFRCGVASVVGGIVGYMIGYYFYNSIGLNILNHYGLAENFTSWKTDFHKWGLWIILLKVLVPIPFKVLTIFAGLTHFNFWIFLLGSGIVRNARFFLLSAFCSQYAPQMRVFLDQYLHWAIIAIVATLVGGYVITQWI